ncbi:MAG: hypothetical protein ACK2T0_06505 [Anaerolineales bacterium]
MRSTRLGCLSPLALVAALIAALTIGGYGLVHGSGMFSPGGLSALTGQPLGGVTSHAAIGDDCGTCHVAPWAPIGMADRCLVCHQNVTAQLADMNSLHGRLEAHVAVVTCRQCHPEHRGAGAGLTNLDPKSFPHELLGFSLNTHQWLSDGTAFTCQDCHTTGDFVSFSADVCSSCHLQMNMSFVLAHQLAFGAACTGCHDGVETLGRAFDHNKVAFRLTGKHADADCSKCHAEAHTSLDLRSAPQECAGCHGKDDPHAGRLGNACSDCHNTDGWKPAKFDHNLAQFKLTGKHATVACEDCHKNDVLQGTPTACAACHQKDDAHGGQFKSDCGVCHNANGWDQVNIDHNQFSFKLVGAHAGVACEKCHINGTFVATPQSCAGCHQKDDPHRGQFAQDCGSCHTVSVWSDVHVDHNAFAFRLTGAHATIDCNACHANGAYTSTPQICGACHSKDDTHHGQFGTDCSQCHTTSAWNPATFDHNQSAFKLTGAHASVPCTSCHTNGKFTGTPQTCGACHFGDDAHKGQLGSACGACHTTTAWKPSTFNHNNSAFKLTGAHSSVPCGSCHVNGVLTGTPTTCSSCHGQDDPHNGAFGSNCAACHSTSAWKPATFDHSQSNFPLTGAHTSLACSACHGNTIGALPTTCASCHDEPAFHAGMFAGQSCSNCHSTSAWQPAQYNGPHSFPMNHGGANGDCSTCHQPNLTTWTCTACHSQSRMDQEHHEVSGYDGNCIKCHANGRSGDD